MSDSLVVALLSVVIHQQGVHGLAHNAAAVTTLGKEFWGRGSKACSSDEHTEMPKVYSYYASVQSLELLCLIIAKASTNFAFLIENVKMALLCLLRREKQFNAKRS